MKRVKKIQKKISGWFSKPWYPIAISAYPVLTLLSSNMGQIQPSAGIRALGVSILFGALLYALLYVILKQTHKAAFLSALWMGLFFSFGHVFIALRDSKPEVDISRWLIIGWAILFALALFWATRPKLTFVSAASPVNTISAALIVMVIWQSASSIPPRAHTVGADHAPVQENLTAQENSPNVYYIILDSYARADFLQSVYQFDNAEFIQALEQRGFYVAECSQSNYSRTEISLGSSLNMMYLQNLDDEFIPKNTGRRTLWNALKHSAARANFETMGYQTINFATGFAWNELEDADQFIAPPAISSGMTEFEGLFLDTTLARYLKDWGVVDSDAVMAQTFRDRFNSVFNHMDDLAKMESPHFAYIHLISPHPPFVFDKDGNEIDPAQFWNKDGKYPYDKYTQGYVGQMQYLNQKVLEAIDILQNQSKTPPVIIIQGDHGPWMQPKDRHMWILNAYYLPEHNDQLYKTISPVNTFRVVFNAYFGGTYELLDDVSYYSPVPNLYDFSVIPNKCQ